MATPPVRREVIDSDGHVVEPDLVWKQYAEPAWREQLDRPGGGVQLLGMKQAYPDSDAEGLFARRAHEEGKSWAESLGAESWNEESRTKMARPGGHDPHARLQDMDADGIDIAVL